ncbi:hypothetical protein J6590_067573 [Homalodisca vitripennis]|nr:hypothetical protein J6590_067573 [Homalodisca vitripennis]
MNFHPNKVERPSLVFFPTKGKTYRNYRKLQPTVVVNFTLLSLLTLPTPHRALTSLCPGAPSLVIDTIRMTNLIRRFLRASVQKNAKNAKKKDPL